MGKFFSKLGTNSCKALLLKWNDGPDSEWKLIISSSEVSRQVLARKCSADEFYLESSKQRCLEDEVHRLQTKVTEQALLINKKWAVYVLP